MLHVKGMKIGCRCDAREVTHADIVTTIPKSTSLVATRAHALVTHPSSPPIEEVIISA